MVICQTRSHFLGNFSLYTFGEKVTKDELLGVLWEMKSDVVTIGGQKCFYGVSQNVDKESFEVTLGS